MPQGIQPQQEELEGAAQATGSPKQLDLAQWVLDEETVLTLLKPREAVFPEVSRLVESLKDHYPCCLHPVNERGFRMSSRKMMQVPQSGLLLS